MALTYADIQRVYRLEKSTPELQKIEDDFYVQARDLLLRVDEEHREYIRKLTCEVFERRRNKIVMHALRSEKASENMVPVERVLFSDLVKALARYRGAVFSDQKDEHGEDVPAAGKDAAVVKVKVRFLSALPSIIGSDMVHYGPFKEGDVADIPIDNARVLIEQDIVEEV